MAKVIGVRLTEAQVERVLVYAETEEIYFSVSPRREDKRNLTGAVAMLALKGLAQWEAEQGGTNDTRREDGSA